MKKKLFLRFLAKFSRDSLKGIKATIVLLLLCLPQLLFAETVTYTVSTSSAVTTSGDAPSGSSVTFKNTYSTAKQMTKGNSQTLTLSGFKGVKITNITLSMHSNNSGGAGSLSYSTDGGSTWTYLIGSSSSGVSFNQSAWYGDWSNPDFVDINKTVNIEVGTSQFLIKIECTANSLYCQSYTITYVPSTTESYTVTYNANGGQGTMTDSNSYTAGSTVTTLTNTFTREGYAFAGWKDGNGSDVGATFTINANTTLYAQWTQESSGGGEGGQGGQDGETVSIVPSDFQGSYSNNNKSHSKKSSLNSDFEFTTYQVNTTNSLVQFQKSNGYLYNTTELGNIEKIEITSSANYFTVREGATSNCSNGNTVTYTQSGTKYTYTFSGNNPYFYIKCGSTLSTASEIKIYFKAKSNTAPAITTQPIGATYMQGATATALAVVASGYPAPSYQWYSNTSNSKSGAQTISGATSASYTPSTTSVGTTYYYCIATNSEGSAESDIVAVTVNAETYTVTYNANGGTGTMTDSNAYTASSTVTVATNAFTREGYTFAGWKDGNGTAFEGSFTINGNTTLYAQWIATVAFNAGTGACTTTSLTELAMGAGVTLPTATPVNGWTFAGWTTQNVSATSTKPTILNAGDIYHPENGSCTLYAVYQRGDGDGETFKLSVTVGNDIHYVGGRTGTNTYMNSVDDESNAVMLGIEESGSKKYLYFMNGSTKTYIYISGDNTKLYFATSKSASVTDWTITESGGVITLETTATGKRNFAYNKQYSRFAAYTAGDNYPYQFTKHTEGGAVYNTNPSATEDVLVESVTLPETLTMTVDDQEALTAVITPADVTDAIITWRSSNTSVATVDNNGKVTAVSKGTADITVTVKTLGATATATCTVTVNPHYYTVTYDDNGGDGTMTDDHSPYEANAYVTVMDNAFTREGYRFTGWDTEPDGTGESYAERASFKITENTTLYAQWELRGELFTIFREGFGNNSDKARDWSDAYKEQSGDATVYSGATYTMTNAKQSKNTVGATLSGLAQSSSSSPAIFEVGPLNMSAYADGTDVTLSYKWKAASIKETYTTNIYYKSTAGGTYVEIPNTAEGATTFVDVAVSVPADALTSTAYFKVVFNTSNTQAVIDEFELSGKQAKVSANLSFDPPTYYVYKQGMADPAVYHALHDGAVTFTSEDENIGEADAEALYGYEHGKVLITGTLAETDEYTGASASFYLHVVPESEPISVGTNGMSTYSFPYPLNFSGISIIRPYAATEVGADLVIFDEINGVIPANTGLMIVGENVGESVDVPVALSATPLTCANYLKPAPADTDIPVTDNEFTRYVFGTKSGIKAFYRLVGTSIHTGDRGHAYLEVPVVTEPAPAAPEQRRVAFRKNGTTGVEEIIVVGEVGYPMDGRMYNVLGQPVDDNYRGIVIKDGKKYLKR